MTCFTSEIKKIRGVKEIKKIYEVFYIINLKKRIF